jgi:hypothetical protein
MKICQKNMIFHLKISENYFKDLSSSVFSSIDICVLILPDSSFNRCFQRSNHRFHTIDFEDSIRRVSDCPVEVRFIIDDLELVK